MEIENIEIQNFGMNQNQDGDPNVFNEFLSVFLKDRVGHEAKILSPKK